MTQQSPRLHKKPEEVEAKFHRLIEAASTLHDYDSSATDSTAKLVRLREIRASSLNLLRRVSSTDGEYYRELSGAELPIIWLCMEFFKRRFKTTEKVLWLTPGS